MNTDKNLTVSLGVNFGKRLCRNLAKNMDMLAVSVVDLSAEPSTPKNKAAAEAGALIGLVAVVGLSARLLNLT